MFVSSNCFAKNFPENISDATLTTASAQHNLLRGSVAVNFSGSVCKAVDRQEWDLLLGEIYCTTSSK